MSGHSVVDKEGGQSFASDANPRLGVRSAQIHAGGGGRGDWVGNRAMQEPLGRARGLAWAGLTGSCLSRGDTRFYAACLANYLTSAW